MNEALTFWFIAVENLDLECPKKVLDLRTLGTLNFDLLIIKLSIKSFNH